ncbi:hypothetical protein CHUAL_002073 [Chamberlinius hualienensis]
MNEMTSSLPSMNLKFVTAINRDKLDEIADYFDRILHLFDVNVCIVVDGGAADVDDFREKEVEQPLSLPDTPRPPSNCNSTTNTTITTTPSSTLNSHSNTSFSHGHGGAGSNANVRTIQLNLTGNISNLERAKKYCESIQLLDWLPNCARLVCPTPTSFQRIFSLRDSIERSSCAVLKLAKDLQIVEIGGRDDCVAAAVAMAEEAINEDGLIQSHIDMNWSYASTGACGHYVESVGGRTKLESEDSSYDSDYENSEPLQSPAAINKKDEFYGKHEDVSRTVSDTLGAEFAEYVGPVVRSRTESTIKELGDQEVNEDVFSDPEYTSRIEFALKLGYTEKQAQVALHKLGSKPQQNELLAELIKLGACNQQKNISTEQHSRGTSSDESLTSSATLITPSRKLDNYPAEGYELRSIVIDGSNVAMSHGNKQVFSCRGIKLCVDWFKSRGHKDITVFVPLWRKEASRPDAIIKDQAVLWELEKERRLVFTPSRQMGGRRMACHDDRYILKLAVETDGIVVSNDNYREFVNENPEFKKVIEERLLMYSFVNDRFMPPDDPLGRHGPSLDSFLSVQKKSQEPPPRPCPYGKKCTYGNKCKFYHPERGNQPHKSISEQLAEQAKINIQEVKARTKNSDHSSPEGNRLRGTLSSPFPNTSSDKPRGKMPLQRTKSLLPPGMEPLNRDVQLSTLVTVTPPPEDSVDSGDSRQNQAWSSHFYGDGSNHLSVAKRLSDPESSKNYQSENGGGSNLHRKLQRQLTLNPVYDPRLIHMRGYAHQQKSLDSDVTEHSPLVRHSSAGAAEALVSSSKGWGGAAKSLHQNVTRIASAPDTYHQWQHMHPSEVHSHYVWGPIVPPPSATIPMPCQQTPVNHGSQINIATSTSDKRNHLYYHLSSIFPKEQVRVAMEAQPDETDPQAICAAILNTFPHSR